MSWPTLVERRRLKTYRESNGSRGTSQSWLAAPPDTRLRRAVRSDPVLAIIVALGGTMILAAALVALGVDFSGVLHDLRALSAWFPR